MDPEGDPNHVHYLKMAMRRIQKETGENWRDILLQYYTESPAIGLVRLERRLNPAFIVDYYTDCPVCFTDLRLPDPESGLEDVGSPIYFMINRDYGIELEYYCYRCCQHHTITPTTSPDYTDLLCKAFYKINGVGKVSTDDIVSQYGYDSDDNEENEDKKTNVGGNNTTGKGNHDSNSNNKNNKKEA
jgi:hypothetical protein